MADLHTIEGHKRQPCPYCGGEPHAGPFACPRIKTVTSYGGGGIEVEFRDPPEPEDAA